MVHLNIWLLDCGTGTVLHGCGRGCQELVELVLVQLNFSHCPELTSFSDFAARSSHVSPMLRCVSNQT